VPDAKPSLCQEIFSRARAGLPDGLFSNQKSQFGKILEGHRLENIDTFNCHLKYYQPIWYILRFGKFCVNLVRFFLFWYHVPRKIWQP
jgi:hypothetical protein